MQPTLLSLPARHVQEIPESFTARSSLRSEGEHALLPKNRSTPATYRPGLQLPHQPGRAGPIATSGPDMTCRSVFFWDNFAAIPGSAGNTFGFTRCQEIDRQQEPECCPCDGSVFWRHSKACSAASKERRERIQPASTIRSQPAGLATRLGHGAGRLYSGFCGLWDHL
jgi:hypothetical protein